MKLRDGHFECSVCGAVIDVPLDATPMMILANHSGKPIERLIWVGGKEIHRCILRKGKVI